MNVIKLKDIFLVLCSTMFLFSCVSTKKYQSLDKDYGKLQERYNELDVKYTEMNAFVEQLKREKDLLQIEVDKIDALNKEIALLRKRLSEMEDLQSKFKTDNQQEVAALLKQLQSEKAELQKKEDELRERNKRLEDLQSALDKKDQAVRELRSKVANALLGFEGKGLTVEQKEGKVYVSMDEKLLFKSGKYDVEPEGVNALRELAKVLEQNTDINVMVEGHTDSIAYRGSGNLIDNWDLSVKRATTVVRALLKGSQIEPIRVIAAGRSEYAPISTNGTTEGRQQNRRTEIILTPKMDELLKLIE